VLLFLSTGRGDQRYGAIVSPGGRVQIRRSGQSWPVEVASHSQRQPCDEPGRRR